MSVEYQSAEPSLRLAELRRKGTDDGVISEWIGEGEARAKMRGRVVFLAKTPRPWDKKFYRKIKGTKDLYELKWKAEGKEFRAAGYDYKGYFVMVLGFTHKQKIYTPHDWKTTAVKRRNEVANGNWEIVEFEP